MRTAGPPPPRASARCGGGPRPARIRVGGCHRHGLAAQSGRRPENPGRPVPVRAGRLCCATRAHAAPAMLLSAHGRVVRPGRMAPVTWLGSLVLAGVVLWLGDKVVAALWPPADWRRAVRAWRRSPQWADAEADVARARDASTASPRAAPAPPPPGPRHAPPPAPRRS